MNNSMSRSLGSVSVRGAPIFAAGAPGPGCPSPLLVTRGQFQARSTPRGSRCRGPSSHLPSPRRRSAGARARRVARDVMSRPRVPHHEAEPVAVGLRPDRRRLIGEAVRSCTPRCRRRCDRPAGLVFRIAGPRGGGVRRGLSSEFTSRLYVAVWVVKDGISLARVMATPAAAAAANIFRRGRRRAVEQGSFAGRGHTHARRDEGGRHVGGGATVGAVHHNQGSVSECLAAAAGAAAAGSRARGWVGPVPWRRLPGGGSAEGAVAGIPKRSVPAVVADGEEGDGGGDSRRTGIPRERGLSAPRGQCLPAGGG